MLVLRRRPRTVGVTGRLAGVSGGMECELDGVELGWRSSGIVIRTR